MPDIFISYSVKDEEIARQVHEFATSQGLEVFLAGISLQEGKQWTPQIHKALKKADWFLLLATKNAFASNTVQQEIGAALITQKNLVPIFWDISPEEAPRWVGDYQGIDLQHMTPETLKERIMSLAAAIRANKVQSILVGGALLAALFFFLARK